MRGRRRNLVATTYEPERQLSEVTVANATRFRLACTVDGEIEYLAVTLWDSIDTIEAFSGDYIEVGHIEPDGLAALIEFDEFAHNYEIVCNTVASV